jgi:hypothetical protein
MILVYQLLWEISRQEVKKSFFVNRRGLVWGRWSIKLLVGILPGRQVMFFHKYFSTLHGLQGCGFLLFFGAFVCFETGYLYVAKVGHKLGHALSQLPVSAS